MFPSFGCSSTFKRKNLLLGVQSFSRKYRLLFEMFCLSVNKKEVTVIFVYLSKVAGKLGVY